MIEAEWGVSEKSRRAKYYEFTTAGHRQLEHKALLLATLGIYGLISFSVSQRERELGVRIALGATAAEIRGKVVADGVRLTVVGLVLGLVAALALGRFASAIRYEVSPYDPVTLAGVMLLFLAVSALASLLPAARASRTDPATVLRSE